MLIGAGLALLLWWLWPAASPPPVEELPVAEATLPEGQGKDSKPRLAPRKPVQPVARVEQKSPEVDAAALREAIARRSKDLEVCNASGAPERLHAKLLMTRKGTVKSVGLSHAGQVPAPVASCVRDRVRAWTFTELALSSEVEVMVTFSLTPGLAGATGG